MRRRSLRFRLTQLALELAGLAAVLATVALTLSWKLSLGLAGLVAIVASIVLERVL